MTTSDIDPDLARELGAVALGRGCELLEVERRGATLRLVLDHPEGVTLQDCEAVSREVSALLDVADYGGSRYTLEVTSPGLDRKLYGPRDFERFVGRRIRITWREEAAESKRTVVGRLESFRASDGGEVSVEELDTAERLAIPLPRVEKARLVPEV